MSSVIAMGDPHPGGPRGGPSSRGNPSSRPGERVCSPARRPAPEPEPSSLAGRYEIIEELGRGGMGVVWRARDTRLPRDVAIKAPLRIRDAESLRRFFKEAEAAAKLDHPNICRILDLGEADGLPYIVLAYVAGRTLADVIEHHTVRPTWAAKFARGVARTIQFAHDRGVIHRDLKPANPMVGPFRDLIVMDFGLARLEGEERKTLTGQVFGTLADMSPEQVRGEARDLGKGCDIDALGVILDELLAGRLPFRGSCWELSDQILRAEPVPPSRINPEVAPELDAIVVRALAEGIEDRLGSMGEIAEAISSHLRHVGASSSSDIGPPATRPGPPCPTPSRSVLPADGASGLAIRLPVQPLREPDRRRSRARHVFIRGAIAEIVLVIANVYRATHLPGHDPSSGVGKWPKPTWLSPGNQTFK